MQTTIKKFSWLVFVLVFAACSTGSTEDKNIAYLKFKASGEKIRHAATIDDIGFHAGSMAGRAVLRNSIMSGTEEKLQMKIFGIANDLEHTNITDLAGKTYPFAFKTAGGYTSAEGAKLTITGVDSLGVSDILGTLYRIEGNVTGNVKKNTPKEVAIEDGKAALKVYQE